MLTVVAGISGTVVKLVQPLNMDVYALSAIVCDGRLGAATRDVHPLNIDA